MEEYRETMEFWNGVFEVDTEFSAEEPLSVEEIDDALHWLAKDSEKVLDFGCGNGKVLLRTLHLSGTEGVGVDISGEAVKVAEEHSSRNGLSDRVEFIQGGLDTLLDFSDDFFDSGIAFNIMDNLLPDDGKKMLEEFERTIESGGKILLKLNDRIDPKQMEEWNAEEISDNLYREESGLYLWNLTDEEVEDLLKKYFEIEEKERIRFEEQDQVNRLYYLRVR